MKKLVLFLFLGLLSLGPVGRIQAEEASSLLEQAHDITTAVYQGLANEEYLQAEDLEAKLGAADEIEELATKGDSRWTYYLEDEQFQVKLVLVYLEEVSGFVESLATLEDKDGLEVPMDHQLFLAVGQELKDTFLADKLMTYEEVAKALPAAKSISLVHDLIIYHYAATEADSEYSLTLLDNEVISFHYQAGKAAKASLDVQAAELDGIHHRSNSKVGSVNRLLGPATAMNYDLINGMLTYAWFSQQADDEIQEVYFYEDFYGAMIALSYQ